MPEVWYIGDPNCPRDAVYIGPAIRRLGLKASIWDNPYFVPLISNPYDAAEARRITIVQYRAWLLSSPLRERIPELRGKDLKCVCAPLPCHGDVLLELANAPGGVIDPMLDWCWQERQNG